MGDLINDECGICDGPGAIYDCGCTSITQGCNCDGTYDNGDVNLDCIINVIDIVNIINVILGISPSNEYSDINMDEIVNVLDLVALVNIILQ